MKRTTNGRPARFSALACVVSAAAAAHGEAAFPWCPADANVDGVVDKHDVPVFFEYWFAGDSSVDINLDGRISVQDVFDFLVVLLGDGCGTPPWEQP